jgi:hypothetical protein
VRLDGRIMLKWSSRHGRLTKIGLPGGFSFLRWNGLMKAIEAGALSVGTVGIMLEAIPGGGGAHPAQPAAQA